MADARKMRDAANEAEQWVLTIMRGSTADSRYTQAVMRQARERIQKLALLLHDAARGVIGGDDAQA